MSLWCLPLSFGSIRLTIWENTTFIELKDGRHYGYWNEMILAILNLCVTVMLSIKFQLIRTYGLGEDVVWRISRCPPWRPSWITERNDFSNSESLYVTVMPSIKFQLNWTYGLGDVVWRISRWPPRRPSWISERNNFSNSESLWCLPLSFRSIRLTVWEEMSFEEFQDGRHGGHLGYRGGTILAILNFYVATMPPTKFQLNPIYGSGGDVEKVKS